MGYDLRDKDIAYMEIFAWEFDVCYGESEMNVCKRPLEVKLEYATKGKFSKTKGILQSD